MNNIVPDEYFGRILFGDYSGELKNRIIECIGVFRALEKTGVSIIFYISAWKEGTKTIWYEFTSKEFIKLLGCRYDNAAELFRKSIIDHRVYKYIEVSGEIEEEIITSDRLSRSRHKLRKKGRKTGVVEAIYKVGMPKDKIVWFKDRASIETYEDDKVCISLGCLVDVSKEMKQKDQISELSEVVSRDKSLLVEAERYAALGQMSAQLFHEIRNPISAIGGFAKRLLDRGMTGETQPYLKVIVKESKKLEEVLKELFDFTQPVDLKKRPSDLLFLVKGSLLLLKSELDQYNINISLKVCDDLPTLELDSKQIEQALIHVIKNGIESMPDEGRLEIKLSKDDCYVYISIKDFGMGIRQIHKKRVSEPFFTTKVYGTGLGLSLAKKAVELHGGSLELLPNEESLGTETIIKLPISEAGVNIL